MSPDAAMLDRECDVLCRYLTGHDASPYLRSRYLAGHEALFASLPDGAMVDRALLAVACRGRMLAALSDAYAAAFRRRSVLRCKLVLLLALLENDAAHHERYDTGAVDGRLPALLKLGFTGVWWGVRLAAAAMLFAPVQLAAALLDRSPRSG